jgi:integrase
MPRDFVTQVSPGPTSPRPPCDLNALTNSAIDAMPIGATLKDTRIRGLEVRRHRSGWSWLTYYRTRDGIARRPKLGTYPTLTIALARDAARKLLGRVAAGEDPSHARAVIVAAPDMNALWERCESEQWNAERKWDRVAKSIFLRHVKPALGATKVRAVTYDAIAAIHAKLKATPNEANRVIAVLSKMLNLAERWGWRDTGSNPCQHVQRYQERKRRRFATPQEILKIGVALDTYGEQVEHLTGVVFIFLLMFSGARPSEIARATPEQLERQGDAGVLRIEKGKTGARDVFLPPQAMRVIDRLPADRTTLAGRVTAPRALWKLVQRDLGAPDLWCRDLRRTFATVALSGGVPIGVVGELLGHKSVATTKIYALLLEDHAQSAAAGIAGRMEKLLGGDK